MLLLLAIALNVFAAYGNPQNNSITAVAGTNVTFDCLSYNPPINWSFRRHNKISDTRFYINYKSSSRYIVTQNALTFTLTIPNVSLDDAGQYICTDNAGYGKTLEYTSLTVVDKIANCTKKKCQFAIVGNSRPLVASVIDECTINVTTLIEIECPSIKKATITQSHQTFLNVVVMIESCNATFYGIYVCIVCCLIVNCFMYILTYHRQTRSF